MSSLYGMALTIQTLVSKTIDRGINVLADELRLEDFKSFQQPLNIDFGLAVFNNLVIYISK